MGGFVWEWIDHGLRQRDERGRERFAYGGDFGEPVHDGNFVADGLLFPDRTPSPGLLDYAAVIAPVRIQAAGEDVRVTNRFDVRDLANVHVRWTLEVDGLQAAAGDLEMPALAAGETATVGLPPEATAAPGGGAGSTGERWITVTASLAGDEPWAPAGHVLSRGQVRLGGRPAPTAAHPGPGPVRRGPDLLLGTGVFDRRTGRLLRLGGIELLAPPRLDLWRAPTDNDAGQHGEALLPLWRALGLDRLQGRLVDVDVQDGALIVRERWAPATTDLGFAAVYRWTAVDSVGGGDGGLRLDVSMVPEGDLPCPLPRVGVRLELPRGLDSVSWYGRGPGEAYADTGYGTWVSRFSATVDQLQTPYVFPQENGNRAEVRWAVLSDGSGAGLRVEGAPTLDLTVRRWSTEQLDRAKHTVELSDEGRLFVNLDAGQQGIGSASCGPGVLPAYRLPAAPTELSVLLADVRPRRD